MALRWSDAFKFGGLNFLYFSVWAMIGGVFFFIGQITGDAFLSFS